MDLREESSQFGLFAATTSRNLSSSSSTFFSANQSPFFSPRSPAWQQFSESVQSNRPCNPIQLNDGSGFPIAVPRQDAKFISPDLPPSPVQCISNVLPKMDHIPCLTGKSTSTPSGYRSGHDNGCFDHQETNRRHWRSQQTASFASSSASLSVNRQRSYDVYIGLHGRKPSLLRFTNWLRAELEDQGLSCFVSDRSRCRNARRHGIVKRGMENSSFGVVILTKKSLIRNLHTIEELYFFSGKENLVPIFFDLGPGDCLFRDIVEKRGELWGKHGGELWHMCGGRENEWKEAIGSLSRVNHWKLEAQDGNWRDCIFKAVTLIAVRLGRKSVVERLAKWREKAGKEEFPYPRLDNFIGRKKELSELEFILFGNTRDSESDYIELKARPREKSLSTDWSMDSGRMNRKEPVLWKESEKEIEMQSGECLPRHHSHMKPKKAGRHAGRRRSMKIVYGKGIACVSGDSGIGKTELLLEFAYRHHQKYKMVLWVGGESRYIRQNFLNICSILGVDVGIEYCPEKSRAKSINEHEGSAISRVRRELMRNIPYLVVIDNLESEKDWWDHRLVMDLLPRFGGETHVVISTHLPRVMNLVPLKLSYLSGEEALSLMQGSIKDDHALAEVDALRIIEDKLGRLTFGLAIVGSILSELPITPSQLLNTLNSRPLMENYQPRKNAFLLKLFEVCFSIFDHAGGLKNLATRMVQSSGWFAPGSIPLSLLALAAQELPEKQQATRPWKKLLYSLTRGCMPSRTRRSKTEVPAILSRFCLARASRKPGHVHFHDLVKLYACQRGTPILVTQATVRTIISHGCVSQHSEHLWAACFLLFGFRDDPVVVDLEVPELLGLVKDVVLPLAIRAFVGFSQCGPALELLELCTNALEAGDEALVAPAEKWRGMALCWKPVRTGAQLNPCLWERLSLLRASVLEARAKLLLRGGQLDAADDLIRKALFIRTSICGDDHPDTVSTRHTLSKLTRLLANFQVRTSPP